MNGQRWRTVAFGGLLSMCFGWAGLSIVKCSGAQLHGLGAEPRRFCPRSRMFGEILASPANQVKEVRLFVY